MRRKEDPTRWSRLFADLGAHGDSLLREEEQEEIAERTRIEVGGLTLADRLRSAVGQEVGLRCLGVEPLRGRLDRVGPDWVQLAEPSTAAVVPLAAVVAVCGLPRWSTVLEGTVDRRLGLRSLLRQLAGDRTPVRAALTDGGVLPGTIDRVGADFLELAEHAPGEPRRSGAVVRVWTLPVANLAVLRRTAD